MLILIILLVGICLGSFINALVWRLHYNSSLGKKSGKKQLSILNGRSMCPNCRHVLSPTDLIPILSWLFLRGRCRYCKKPISFQYPLVEFISMALALISYLSWPYGFGAEGTSLFVIWILILVGLIALIVYDVKYYKLPNVIVFPLIGLTLAGLVIRLVFHKSGYGFITGEFWGLLLSAGLFYGIYRVSNGRWIGGGDVKFAVVIGLLLGGPSRTLLTIFMSSLIGTVVCLPLLISGRLKRNSLVPFGPFLIAATIIGYLYGIHIVDWYKSIIT